MSVVDDLAALGLPADPEPTHAELDARWRVLRSDLHPDRGGDSAAFSAARQAYLRARAWLSRSRRCPECDGLGFDHVQRGWSVVKLPCSRCRGTGSVTTPSPGD